MGPMDTWHVDELVELRGAEVLGIDGGRIGTVEQIWVDNVNALPEWAEVRIGRGGRATRYVPLRAADLGDGRVTVNYTPEEVEQSPDLDPRTAGRDGVEALYRHFRQPLPAPPPPQVRNPFDRMTARWVPGTHERIEEIANRFPEPGAGRS
ncbi:MAG: PRC-barrel domain-containing protein [Acidimicrobiales bacterium]